MPSPNFSPGSIKCVNKVFHKILNKVAHKIVIKCFLQPSTICSDRKKSHSHVILRSCVLVKSRPEEDNVCHLKKNDKGTGQIKVY